ncbi:MAG TPA: rRNA maturation RNase YbeY [Planctomycetaceae bacterium]|jgi:probable rRNA maturation factor
MPKYLIAIANRQRGMKPDRRAVRALARSVLALEQVAAAEISVALVDDDEIHEINRTFLNHDFPTDVISFLLDVASGHVEPERPARATPRSKMRHKQSAVERGADRTIRRGAGKTIDGEIVISVDTARRNAADLGTSAEHELSLYLVHGLLHLCGYDDLTPREKRLMRRREAEALRARE